jgi:hypothetical protein
MAADSFRLFPFQEEAAQAMRDAALGWQAYAVTHPPPRYGAARIPFLGQLKAVTGSGCDGLSDHPVRLARRTANINGRRAGLLDRGGAAGRGVRGVSVSAAVAGVRHA